MTDRERAEEIAKKIIQDWVAWVGMDSAGKWEPRHFTRLKETFTAALTAVREADAIAICEMCQRIGLSSKRVDGVWVHDSVNLTRVNEDDAICEATAIRAQGGMG